MDLVRRSWTGNGMAWLGRDRKGRAAPVRVLPLRKPSLSWAPIILSLLDTGGIWAASTPHQRK